ncbi:MAG TPA: hypothetical protein VF655_13795 [Allosphingosinicella sp.]|jgi:hypothetical protein
MKRIGIGIGGLGLLLLLIAFGTDTAPEGTHNIGLMQSQMMVFTLGCLLTLAGVIIGTVAHVLSRMEAAGLLPPAGTMPQVGHKPSSALGVDA